MKACDETIYTKSEIRHMKIIKIIRNIFFKKEQNIK